MKNDAVILNFSRDTLVDTQAMADALEDGQVGKYITDFATPEVMRMKNVVVLPHLGASTAEAEDNCAVMAVRQMMDYIENGNIKNSVNYPACDAGAVKPGKGRIAVLHENTPNMISQITEALGAAGANVDSLTNKARGAAAYTLIDVDGEVPTAAAEKIGAIEGVRRVRLVA